MFESDISYDQVMCKYVVILPHSCPFGSISPSKEELQQLHPQIMVPSRRSSASRTGRVAEHVSIAAEPLNLSEQRLHPIINVLLPIICTNEHGRNEKSAHVERPSLHWFFLCRGGWPRAARRLPVSVLHGRHPWRYFWRYVDIQNCAEAFWISGKKRT